MMQYFTIEKNSGKVCSVTDYKPDVPEMVLVRRIKEGELDLFKAGHTHYNPITDSLVKDKIRNADTLRIKLLSHGNVLLNALVKSKGYLNLSDVISFKDSNDVQMKADATAAIAAKDKWRIDVLAFVDGLPSEFAISFDDALAQIDEPSW